MMPPGTEPLPTDAPFRFDPAVPIVPYKAPGRVRGMLLGLFGPAGNGSEPGKPTHVLVVNLDYQTSAVAPLVGPGNLEAFDAAGGTWSPVAGNDRTVRLPPGGGKLLRVPGGPQNAGGR
jgi:hypothetical protein